MPMRKMAQPSKFAHFNRSHGSHSNTRITQTPMRPNTRIKQSLARPSARTTQGLARPSARTMQGLSHPSTSMMRPANPNRFVTPGVLHTTAARMLPFYRAIADNGAFAAKWSRAVVQTDLTEMERLLRKASPAAKAAAIGTNGIGYFVSFAFPQPIIEYTNGTTIPPGSVQFFFETRAHRALARAVLPLYRELAHNRCFAAALARAIRRNDQQAVNRMVRSLVKGTQLRSVSIESSGIALAFAFSFSRFVYRNLLFREDVLG